MRKWALCLVVDLSCLLWLCRRLGWVLDRQPHLYTCNWRSETVGVLVLVACELDRTKPCAVSGVSLLGRVGKVVNLETWRLVAPCWTPYSAEIHSVCLCLAYEALQGWRLSVRGYSCSKPWCHCGADLAECTNALLRVNSSRAVRDCTVCGWKYPQCCLQQ